MGLDFLRAYGGSRVRHAPDQPELDLSPEAGEDDDIEHDQEVDHDYEQGATAWRLIDVNGVVVDWDEAPRRFVDGCHVGHTVAWLRDADGHPVPLMLAELGGICVTREGRELRRTFHVVERVVSLVADPFPWHEVEAFANALSCEGFRLLPAGAPDERAAWFDFEAMRRKAQNRSNYEMEVLEEAALCQDPATPTVVDGRLEPRINSDSSLQERSIFGVVKQHRKNYLHERGWRVFYDLEPGQRTPAFLIRDADVPVVSWYLKLDGGQGSLPSWGAVRVEVAQRFYESHGWATAEVNRLSCALYAFRCGRANNPRGPVALEPVVRAEESLRALFSPTGWLRDRFYHLTDI